MADMGHFTLFDSSMEDKLEYKKLLKSEGRKQKPKQVTTIDPTQNEGK
jgi:hypothetical protein